MKTSILALAPVLASSAMSTRGLTKQEEQLLQMFEIQQQPDGLGGTVTTVVLSGVNLQVVNGAGATSTANGAGNIILGYNELGNYQGDVRTGSHFLIYGTEANYTGGGGLIGGSQNAVGASGGAILGGSGNRIEDFALGASIAGGSGNRVSGMGSFVGSGAGNICSALNSAILGGNANRAGEGADVTVSGGSGCAASGFASSMSGGTARFVSSSGAWRGGSYSSPN